MSPIQVLFAPVFVVLTVAVPVFGYLLAQSVTHGLDPTFWPDGTDTPAAWFDVVMSLSREAISDRFIAMARGQHEAFAGGGRREFAAIAAATLYSHVLWFILALGSTRATGESDPAILFGSARWATPRERQKLSRGLEIGLDPDTGRSVRVQVESNLLTIAPPRAGKTSAFIINNLLMPDKTAWQGPAVVIDPKGEIFQATQRRRQELGRSVHFLDLRRNPVGTDRWNPLSQVDIDDVLYLLRAAYSILPAMPHEHPYFRQRSAMILAGIMAAAILEARGEGREAAPSDVERLLSQPALLGVIAEQHQDRALLRSLASDLRMEARALDQLLSTVKLAVIWLLDQRLRALVSQATFDLKEVARGRADLYVTIPTADMEIAAPFLRWLMADLFEAIRNDRSPQDERVVLFIDEARTLGDFSQLLVGLGEMPGRGLSVWTFWQNRSQIEACYGAPGARTFYGTAAVSTFSDVYELGDEDVEWFSRTLGERTQMVQSTSEQTRSTERSSSTNLAPQAVRLMTPSALRSMPRRDAIVLLAATDTMPAVPIRLRKVRYFEDDRFAGLFDDIPPAGPSL